MLEYLYQQYCSTTTKEIESKDYTFFSRPFFRYVSQGQQLHLLHSRQKTLSVAELANSYTRTLHFIVAAIQPEDRSNECVIATSVHDFTMTHYTRRYTL